MKQMDSVTNSDSEETPPPTTKSHIKIKIATIVRNNRPFQKKKCPKLKNTDPGEYNYNIPENKKNKELKHKKENKAPETTNTAGEDSEEKLNLFFQHESTEVQEDSETDFNIEDGKLNGKFDNEMAGSLNKNFPQQKSPVGPLLGASDDESDMEGGVLEQIRKENEKKLKEIVNNLRDPDLEKKLASFKQKNNTRMVHSGQKSSRKMRKKTKGSSDLFFKYYGNIPVEKRKSLRLQNKQPEYRYDDLDDTYETKHETLQNRYLKRPHFNLDDYLVEDLEDVVYRPKRRSTGARKVGEHIIIPVEDVTQSMLDNIATRGKAKVYVDNGTTCHQCRQKTLDQKTCCRNPECSGGLGMFCGVCIKNRYGEDAAEALLNPEWICPVCRGKCNCSICRTNQGKRPTGVLAPLAQRSGYESVDHFLDTLRGEGDRPQDDYKYVLKRDPEALLGFSDNGQKTHLRNGISDILFGISCALQQCYG